MAPSEDLIDFDVIEQSKENIQALPSGRSAKSLAAVLSPRGGPLRSPLTHTQDAHADERQTYENELLAIDDSDDPLDVYDRYVKWTLDTYPSAQATPQSQLLPLLERATRAFLSSPHYKNDPRYLRLWLHYIRFFSDSPRETFAYLARHSIGEALALYYEEFAAWLENAGRWTQAEEIYKMGIQKEARPTERLLRKFGEYEKRRNAKSQEAGDGPSSPVLPTVRPALAQKVEPFAVMSPTPAGPSSDGAQQRPTSRKPKLEIFSDAGAEEKPVTSGAASKGWETIGTLADRKKENTMAAKPWAGETLKSSGPRQQGVPKMMIFKDQSKKKQLMTSSLRSSRFREQRVVNPRTGRIECVAVNLDAIYPNPADTKEEYCFEELRAARRGWWSRDWRKESTSTFAKEPSLPVSVPVKFDDSPVKEVSSENAGDLTIGLTQQLILNDQNDENGASRPAPKPRDDVARRMRREDRANRTRKIKVREVKEETQTVQTNLDSPRGPKLKKKKRSVEATMTVVTKAATDDVYDIFNQPLSAMQAEKEESDAASDSEEEDDEDDYTSGAESTDTGHISASASDFGDDTQGDLEDDDHEVTATTTAFSELGLAGDNTQESIGEIESDATTTHDVHSVPVTKDLDLSRVSLSAPQGENEWSPEEITTPTSPAPPETKQTSYIPIQPEDYQPQRYNPYRDPNSRLPFMTPIVEKTESSLGALTQRREDHEEFTAKTPCPKTFLRASSMPEEEEEDEVWSPFRDSSAPLPIGSLVQSKLVTEEPAILNLSLVKVAGAPLTEISVIKLEQTRESQVISDVPIIKDVQVNPMDPALQAQILAEIYPAFSSYQGYANHDSASFQHKAKIGRFCKALKATKVSGASPQVQNNIQICFPEDETTYNVKRELGAGAFAPVYLVEESKKGMPEETKPDLLALKLFDASESLWEFFIISLIHRRLAESDRSKDSVITATALHVFQDESHLLLPFQPHGTLLNAINRTRESANAGMDETLAMFFAIELLRTVESLHSIGVIHGDLKADNIMLRLPSSAADSVLDAQYHANGTGGWSSRGIRLIDLGRGIPLFAPSSTTERPIFTSKVGFVADWPTAATDCPEMREGRPWTWQCDYFGIAGILHTLLFGKYIETCVDSRTAESSSSATNQPGLTKSWKLKEPLKRYWQTDIWAECFGLLLNPTKFVSESENQMASPLFAGEEAPLKKVRVKMEEYLEANCEKRGIGLRALVRRLEGLVGAS